MTANGPGRAETLFPIPSPVTSECFYTVHPDGKRFFMQRWASEGEAADSNRLTVMLDFLEPVTK